MLTVLSMALEAAKDAGLVQVNVANPRLVERPKGGTRAGEAWTVEQVATFLRFTSGTRYEAAWRVSLCGLRRSEVLGLTWGAIDLERGTLAVTQSRTVRKGKDRKLGSTVVDVPKRPRSVRTIPLPPAVVASLRAFKVRRKEEALASVSNCQTATSSS